MNINCKITRDKFIELENKMFKNLQEKHCKIIDSIESGKINLKYWESYTKYCMKALDYKPNVKLGNDVISTFLPYMLIYQNYNLSDNTDSPSDDDVSDSLDDDSLSVSS